MMNRVFAPNAPIDLETVSSAVPTLAPGGPIGPRAQAPVPSRPRGGSDLTLLGLAVLGGFGLAGALGALVLGQQWAGLQNNLTHERNLLLVERLRGLGPASAPAVSARLSATPPPPVLDPAPAPTAEAGGAMDGLPPPPPEEPWMTQLADLPAPAVKPLPLQVPLNTRLTAPAPPASAAAPAAPAVRPTKGAAPTRASAPLPQLVGLVGAPGGAGSAIFQLGDSSVNVGVGESIGDSGWRLRSADDESAVIERGTERRRISILAGG
jgi:hypothetical protein